MTNNAIDTGKPIEVFNGGTTQVTLNNNGLLYGQGAGPVAVTAAGTNGQTLIASTGNPPAFANLTSPGNTIVFGTGPNILTLQTSGASANSFVTDAGTATPVTGSLNVFGGNNNRTTGSGNTITDSVFNTTNHAVQVGTAPGALNSIGVGATNTVLLGNTGADPSFGPVPNGALAHSSFTLNSGNNITVTGSPVSLGGSASIAVTGTTNHAVELGNVTNSLTSSNVGTNGELLIGATGANPVFNSLTSADNTIIYTPGPNSLNLMANITPPGPFSNGTPEYLFAYCSTNQPTTTGGAGGVWNVRFDTIVTNFGSGWTQDLAAGMTIFNCHVAGVYWVYYHLTILGTFTDVQLQGGGVNNSSGFNRRYYNYVFPLYLGTFPSTNTGEIQWIFPYNGGADGKFSASIVGIGGPNNGVTVVGSAGVYSSYIMIVRIA